MHVQEFVLHAGGWIGMKNGATKAKSVGGKRGRKRRKTVMTHVGTQKSVGESETVCMGISDDGGRETKETRGEVEGGKGFGDNGGDGVGVGEKGLEETAVESVGLGAG